MCWKGDAVTGRLLCVWFRLRLLTFQWRDDGVLFLPDADVGTAYDVAAVAPFEVTAIALAAIEVAVIALAAIEIAATALAAIEIAAGEVDPAFLCPPSPTNEEEDNARDGNADAEDNA